MFKRLLAFMAVVLFLGLSAAVAQSNNSAQQDVPNRSYQLLRDDEDWSFLRDPRLRQDFWDPVKYIRLRKGADNWYMTIAGEARQVWEQVGNDNFGQAPFMNGYLNERYMLSFDLHYGDHVRTFFELKSGLNSFRFGGPRPIDEKKLDFQAGYLELGTAETRNWIRVRAGRQEMEYGSGRLIDVREGPNVRLSFDGFKVLGKINSWRIDGFAMRPDEDNFGFFDNIPNPQIGFWGVWATRPLSETVSLDAFYLGLDRKRATLQRGTAQEVRHSIGARFSRPIATERPALDFDYEALCQFGTFGSANIRAWTVASETGYRFPTMKLQPRFSAKADISSGDHPISNPNTLGTFNPLFPKGDYFGVLATVGPGPINFIDVHPRIDLTFPHNITAFVDWLFYWRQSLEDGVYSVPGFLIRAADGSRARFVGHRIGTQERWQVTTHIWFQADYGIFYAGRFLKETKPGRNLNYWALWAGYKF
jgi:Alginate export